MRLKNKKRGGAYYNLKGNDASRISSATEPEPCFCFVRAVTSAFIICSKCYTSISTSKVSHFRNSSWLIVQFLLLILKYSVSWTCSALFLDFHHHFSLLNVLSFTICVAVGWDIDRCRVFSLTNVLFRSCILCCADKYFRTTWPHMAKRQPPRPGPLCPSHDFVCTARIFGAQLVVCRPARKADKRAGIKDWTAFLLFESMTGDSRQNSAWSATQTLNCVSKEHLPD